MAARKLKEFLDKERVKYVSVQHSPAYTAQEVAASAHVSGKEMAKTIIVHINKKMCMVVLPANRYVKVDDLRSVTGEPNVEFASEEEFKDLFPDCEIGAMPPFGNLYGLEVYVEPSLAGRDEIAFNAGTHTEVIKMSYPDFSRLVRPKVANFTT